MTSKTPVRRLLVLALLLVLVAGLAAWWLVRGDHAPSPPPPRVAAAPAPAAAATVPAVPPRVTRAAEPDDTDGVIDGRVVNGETHAGVPDAELSFAGEGMESTFRTSSDGTFELTPTVTGSFALSSVTAPGFLPYTPARGNAGMRVTLARGRSVHGVTLVLYPAVDYQGRVIDERGAPVAGARIRLVSSHAGEQMPENLTAEWRSDADGRFTFQATDDSLLEASRGSLRAWGRVDRFVTIQKQLTIQLGRALPRDATITGHVRDGRGAPIAEALVRASSFGAVPTAFAASDAGGAFTLANVDRAAYDVSAEAEDHLRAVRVNVLGGSRNVDLVLDTGLPLAGHVVDGRGAPVPVFTLIAMRRAGSARPVLANQSLVDPQGRFSVRVPAGDYDLLVSARGWARSTQAQATAGATDVRIVLGAGAILRGRVVAARARSPAPMARSSWPASPPDRSRSASSPTAITPGSRTRCRRARAPRSGR
ncbi:MAG: carboxypeptidase regulatory-like domain-containing protein [Deltaproteobacteria bacterium]|nr:MAG: carboxypeptidase regulatory-like domain-containing protein [Deltaproteobacteria bacterium]